MEKMIKILWKVLPIILLFNAIFIALQLYNYFGRITILEFFGRYILITISEIFIYFIIYLTLIIIDEF